MFRLYCICDPFSYHICGVETWLYIDRTIWTSVSQFSIVNVSLFVQNITLVFVR